MKRIFTTAAVLLTLLAAAAASSAAQPSLAGTSAPSGAAPAVISFAPPLAVPPDAGGDGPAVIAASTDGTANLINSPAGATRLSLAENHVFYGPFDTQTLDSSDNQLGHARMVSDSHGRLHAAWYVNNSDGTTFINYGRKDPGTNGGHWQVSTIPGSNTGGNRVIGIARGLVAGNSDRIYVLWGRNSVGAFISWTDDGVNWAPVLGVPGPFSDLPTSFDIGATIGGYAFVGWFDRSPGHIFVQMLAPNGQWGPVTDVSDRPDVSQDYTPRFGTAPDGGLRLAWTGFAHSGAAFTDGFYREWTPAGGWSPNIVQLWSTPGGGDSGSLELVVDNSGVSHIVWDDDSGRSQGDVTGYYIRGRGTVFTAPVPIVLGFGSAASRYPDIDVKGLPDGTTKVHAAINSNVSGGFVNYYTWTDAGLVPVNTPVPTRAPTHTPTHTPTPTPCTSGQFTDVLPGSTYYAWVKDLTRRGAISGYGDCTFRPFNTLTRSQAAKVLVVAFGFRLLNPATGHFSDVPPGSAFYQFVETAYAHNVISGYADGSFRPFNFVTRGQISKMVALGKNWQLLNPSAPTFSDVPPGSVFYQFVETAYSLGVISGYSCGTNCRVFHVSATANRGQASKVIDIAITVVQPTFTRTPAPTHTPAPPTATPIVPTSTAVPPSATAVPASATPVPTNTPGPTATTTPPVIAGVNPTSVEQYDTLTVIDMSGLHFGVVTGTLGVNNVPATIVSWTDQLIQFQIGIDTPPARPSTVRVITSDGRSASSIAFEVLPRQRPYVFSYTPSTVPQGNTTIAVTVQGAQFGTITGTIVLAGQYTATIQSWTDTAIIFHIAADTPAYNPIYVGIQSPQNGFYKEYGGFGVVGPSPTPTATPGLRPVAGLSNGPALVTLFAPTCQGGVPQSTGGS